MKARRACAVLLAATLVVLALGALAGAGPAAAGLASSPDLRSWVTDGFVDALAVGPDGTTYLGGSFTYVGPNTGGGAPLDAGSGALVGDLLPVNGEVAAVAPDGAGGCFIGGRFGLVGDSVRSRVAHILADGSLDPAWHPAVSDAAPLEGVVLALAVSGDVVYMGGLFTLVDGQPRSGIAAVSATTGAVTDWNPGVDGIVNAIAVADGIVYIGGTFGSVDGQTRQHLAAVDAATGDATGWAPSAGGGGPLAAPVQALAVADGLVYAGGAFTSIGSDVRNHLAAIDATTGAATGWNPNAGGTDPVFAGTVFALAVADGLVYAGGAFTSIGSDARNHLAAIDAASGAATEWSPNANGWVSSLALAGSTLYVGGQFTSIGGQARRYLAAFNTASDAATDWRPNAGGAVAALAASGATVYVGGQFTSVGGVVRNRLAALDARGVATSWDPEADGSVSALAVADGLVYAGGFFTTIGSEARTRLAAIDAVSGKATGWDPKADAAVSCLAVAGDTIYAGGAFTTIGSDTRNRLAAIDATTGLATAWDPNVANASGSCLVRTIALSGNTIYAGGAFTSIGSDLRRCIAAIDATSGRATNWNPGANGEVFAIVPVGDLLYVGGAVSSIGGKARENLAALTAGDGVATDWNPNADSAVYALAVLGATVYAGGDFRNMGDLPRTCLAAVDATTGAVTEWDPDLDQEIEALALSGTTLYAGGIFETVGAYACQGIAAFRGSPEVTVAPATAQYSDCISLEATVAPPGRGRLGFLVDGSRAGLMGRVSYEAASGVGGRGYRVVLPAGEYPIAASFSPEDTTTVYSGEATLTVTPEAMTVTPCDAKNPATLAVPWQGRPSGPFLLAAGFAQERDGCYGALAGTRVSCELVPVAGGVPLGAPAPNGTTYTRTVRLLGLPGPTPALAVFAFSGIPVGEYAVRYVVADGRYLGAAERRLSITAPPLVWQRWVEPAASTYRVGATIKVAFLLKDGVTTDQATLTVTGPGGVVPVEGGAIVYDPASGQHRFYTDARWGLVTAGWAKGSYKLTVELPGGSSQTKTIRLK